MSALYVFYTFAKFGLLCFGGGYMLIPLLVAEFVGTDKVLSAEQFGNLVSISQLTPGPVGINVATFIGYIYSSVPGALAGTLGLVFPTLILAGAAVSIIRSFQDAALFKGLLYGARLAAVALICYAVLVFLEMSVFTGGIPWKHIGAWLCGKTLEAKSGFSFSFTGLFILLLSVFMIKKLKLSTTWVILISGAIGAAFKLFT